MDLFCEYLVKKKSMSDNLKRAGLILACVAVCFAIIYFSLFVKRAFISAMPILVAAAIYGTVIFGRNFSLEYEYIFTNGVLDIDVIKGRARRAKLISVPCRKPLRRCIPGRKSRPCRLWPVRQLLFSCWMTA